MIKEAALRATRSPGTKSPSSGPTRVRINVNDAQGRRLLHHYLKANNWESPAGNIEGDESPEQAAVRELLERTGYEGIPEDFAYGGVDDDFHVYSVPFEKLKQIAKPGERGGYSTRVKWEKKAEDEESWYISTSTKEGKGLFVEKAFEPGETIFHAGELDRNEYGLDDWEMTEAAMACNHSRTPNALVVRDGEELSAVASEPIGDDDEVFVSYYQVTNVIGPGSRLTHNNKPIPPVSAEEMSKWARAEKMDWIGLVHGHARN